MIRIWAGIIVVLTTFCMGHAYGEVFHKMTGVPVYLIVPDGYGPAEGFSGLANMQTEGAILTIKLPDNLGVGDKALLTNAERFKEVMAQQNFRILKHYDIKTDQGYSMRIYQGKQTGHGLIYDKWAGISFNDKGGFLITIQALEGKGLPEETIMKIFTTARFEADEKTDEKLAALPFQFMPVYPFVFKDTMMGTGAVLQPDSNVVKEQKGVPSIIINMDIATYPAGDALTAQKATLKTIENAYPVAKVLEEKPMNFAGQKGRFFYATVNLPSGEADFILYTAVNQDGKALTMMATTPKGELVLFKDAIVKTAATVKYR